MEELSRSSSAVTRYDDDDDCNDDYGCNDDDGDNDDDNDDDDGDRRSDRLQPSQGMNNK
jgi:hypothetical protein